MRLFDRLTKRREFKRRMEEAYRTIDWRIYDANRDASFVSLDYLMYTYDNAITIARRDGNRERQIEFQKKKNAIVLLMGQKIKEGLVGTKSNQ